jgi:signal transduction histidine kinase
VRLDVLKGLLLTLCKDSGIGIDSNKIDIIFERFRQVDDSLQEL